MNAIWLGELDVALWREPLSARLVRAIGPECPTVKEVAWGAAVTRSNEPHGGSVCAVAPYRGSFAWRIDGKRALNDEDLA
jgi:hypothetical protein